MKRIFTLFLIIATLQSVNAQTPNLGTSVHTINIGTAGYVTIDGQNYKRGYLATQYADSFKYNGNWVHDSTLGLYYLNTGSYFIKPTIDTLWQYGDSAGKKAYNMQTLRNWFNTNFEYIGY